MFYFYLEESNYVIVTKCHSVLQVLRRLFNLFLRKRREISIFVLFVSVKKMWKVVPNWLAHLKVEIILFWHHGHCKMDFYLVWPHGLTDADLLNIRYHVKSCYAKYKGSGARFTETPTPSKREASPESAPFSPKSRLKRVKITVNVREKPCIFCNQFKCQGNTERYRISEVNDEWEVKRRRDWWE